MVKIISRISICVSALIFFFISGEQTVHPDQRYVIKLATVAPDGSIWLKHLAQLDSNIRKKSNGRLSFRIYPGGVAGDELNVLKKIRIGQIHCAAFTGVGFGQILPEVRVMDLPFLFENDNEADLVHNELFSFFSKKFKTKGFELLSWGEVGNVHLFSQKPIRKLADIHRLKAWMWSGDPIAKETYLAMGVTPVPLEITDVTTALNTGMIDTVYAPPLGALALQWDTSVKYMTSLPLAHSTGAVLISSTYFSKLPKDLADILKTEMLKAMADLTLVLREQNKESIKILQNKGITIIPRPEGKDLEEFLNVHSVVAKQLTGKIYPKELLKDIYRIMKKPI